MIHPTYKYKGVAFPRRAWFKPGSTKIARMELKSAVMDCLHDVFHAEQYSLYRYNVRLQQSSIDIRFHSRNVAAVVGGL